MVGKSPTILTPMEFKLLKTIMDQEGAVITAEQLHWKVFGCVHRGDGVDGYKKHLAVHLARLRAKLRRVNADHVETIVHQGYRWKVA